MKSLLKWQAVSLVSRGIAMALGIVQSAVILRVLSVSEWGLVTLAMSVGSAFGIYQHLGLASGSTREISSAKSDKQIIKIFFTSFVIRYFVTIPLAIILFVLSNYIAIVQYSDPALVTPLRIFSLVLMIQGVQSIFNSVISGTQRFKQLFTYQVAIAFVSLVFYIPLTYFYKVDGYFIALALFNLVGSITLGFVALKPLKTKFVLPTKGDFKVLLKDILSISLGIYAVKIVYMYWQKSGPLLLGLNFSAEQIGVFGLALLYGAKLMAVSDAVTTVNLPVLSRKFVNDLNAFKDVFLSNFNKVFAFIIFAGVSAVYWVEEIVHIFVGGDKYDEAFVYILPIVFAFIFYSVVNIVKSSVLVPAKLVKEMIFGYLLMLGTTVCVYFSISPLAGGMYAMALGMAIGSFVGVLFFVLSSYHKLKFIFFNMSHIILLIIGFLWAYWAPQTIAYKVLYYIGISGLWLMIMFGFKILTKDHISRVLSFLRIKK